MKRTPLRAIGKRGRERQRQSSMNRLLRELWRSGLGPCAMGPNGCDGHVDAHHIVKRQTLRTHGHQIEEWNLANRLPLCRAHHEAHHSGANPVPRILLPASVFEFADDLGLGWWVDRHYPESVAA